MYALCSPENQLPGICGVAKNTSTSATSTEFLASRQHTGLFGGKCYIMTAEEIAAFPPVQVTNKRLNALLGCVRQPSRADIVLGRGSCTLCPLAALLDPSSSRAEYVLLHGDTEGRTGCEPTDCQHSRRCVQYVTTLRFGVRS